MKPKTVQIRLSRADKIRWRFTAAQQGKTLSKFIRDVCNESFADLHDAIADTGTSWSTP
jgi:hypothetical protein